MAMSAAQYAVWLENTEQAITARNIEEYLVENPGPYPPAPDPTYAEWLVAGRAQMLECLEAGNVHAAVLTTGSTGAAEGRATLEYPEMTTPVVVATAVDPTENNVYYQVAVESVGSESAVVRVTQNTSVTLLGIAVLTVPTLAAGVTVHVMAYDAG
ncbi:hypothetical protein NTR1_62 [Nocardia phage NTR1]|nr:hypothetical protein NTR1_62 [Nocardia phage NTR1]